MVKKGQNDGSFPESYIDPFSWPRELRSENFRCGFRCLLSSCVLNPECVTEIRIHFLSCFLLGHI